MVGLDDVEEIVSAWNVQLPDVEGLPLALAKRAALLNGVFDTVANVELEKLGLTPAEFKVLATLRRIGWPYRLKPSDLTHAVLLSSGGTSNVIKRLVAVGHVTRAAAEDDGRSTWVQLSPRGVEIAERAVRATNAAHTKLVERMPEQTARLLSESLRAALAAIEEGVLIRR